jgi:hypothetical protein
VRAESCCRARAGGVLDKIIIKNFTINNLHRCVALPTLPDLYLVGPTVFEILGSGHATDFFTSRYWYWVGWADVELNSCEINTFLLFSSPGGGTAGCRVLFSA